MTKHNQRASDNATISSVNYSINSIGQRFSRTSTDAANATSTAQWGYNATGEVSKADHSDTALNRAYNYDGIGNRLTSSAGVSPASTTTYTPNALNQYTAVNTFIPTYDDDGNQINAQIYPQSPTSSPASLSPVSCVFSWDGENRKIEVKDTSNNSLVKHHYDSQSRKIATITPTEITLYIYNGWNSIAEYQLHNSSFTLHTSLLWGLDLSGGEQGAGGVGGLLQTTDHSSLLTSYFPCYDGNGNVTEYIDSAGAISAHYQYDAFGNTTVASGIKANDFAYRFSTKPIDLATDLYYYGYRLYNPIIGRWLNRDPIEEKGGANLYGFVANNPISTIDLLGHSRVWKIFFVGSTGDSPEYEDVFDQDAVKKAPRRWAWVEDTKSLSFTSGNKLTARATLEAIDKTYAEKGLGYDSLTVTGTSKAETTGFVDVNGQPLEARKGTGSTIKLSADSDQQKIVLEELGSKWKPTIGQSIPFDSPDLDYPISAAGITIINNNHAFKRKITIKFSASAVYTHDASAYPDGRGTFYEPTTNLSITWRRGGYQKSYADSTAVIDSIQTNFISLQFELRCLD